VGRERSPSKVKRKRNSVRRSASSGAYFKEMNRGQANTLLNRVPDEDVWKACPGGGRRAVCHELSAMPKWIKGTSLMC